MPGRMEKLELPDMRLTRRSQDVKTHARRGYSGKVVNALVTNRVALDNGLPALSDERLDTEVLDLLSII